MIKRCWIAMCLCALTVSAGIAQEAKNVPPSPTLTNQGFALDSAAGGAKIVAPENYLAFSIDFPSTLAQKGITEIDPTPTSVEELPPTMMVKTEALLELHSMRKSAVNLCIQLPTKYRTHLPECADIFKHEIRLQGLARDKR